MKKILLKIQLKHKLNCFVGKLISFIIGLLPYHFTQYIWYKRLLWYYYIGKHIPVNLWVLDEISLMYYHKNEYLDMYEYYTNEEIKI